MYFEKLNGHLDTIYNLSREYLHAHQINATKCNWDETYGFLVRNTLDWSKKSTWVVAQGDRCRMPRGDIYEFPLADIEQLIAVATYSVSLWAPKEAMANITSDFPLHIRGQNSFPVVLVMAHRCHANTMRGSAIKLLSTMDHRTADLTANHVIDGGDVRILSGKLHTKGHPFNPTSLYSNSDGKHWFTFGTNGVTARISDPMNLALQKRNDIRKMGAQHVNQSNP